MESDSEARTSPTLLGRLRQAPADQAAWGLFVDRYGPRLYAWCRHWRLQHADAQDVTQVVLTKLAQKLRTFAYDRGRSFRGWLKTLTDRACSDLLQARQRPGAGSGDSRVAELLQTVAARADLGRRLEEEYDRELLEEAMARVRRRVQARTWDAFRLLALEGRSGAEAAAALGMKVATAFVARSKVQKMIQAELGQLEGPGPEAGGDRP
jgi:RNA polymerase sigma-70 factor (ECF subfamily)